jgi:hypothetical protein
VGGVVADAAAASGRSRREREHLHAGGLSDERWFTAIHGAR